MTDGRGGWVLNIKAKQQKTRHVVNDRMFNGAFWRGKRPRQKFYDRGNRVVVQRNGRGSKLYVFC